MKNKFTNITIDEGTITNLEVVTKFEKIDALYQKWNLDEISAESLIFVNSDIDHLTEQELWQMLNDSPLLKEKDDITYTKTNSGFTFLNFNFIIK